MQQAFSLIEMAVVLLVVGLMVGFGLQALGGKSGADCTPETEARLKVIDGALKNFVAVHSRLPKPAFANQGTANPAYGSEAMGSVTDPTLAAYGTDIPAGMTSNGGVLIGAVPHTALGLTAEHAGDCWGGKFTYAVTNALTSSDRGSGYPSSAAGSIILRGNTLASPTLLSNTISYLVVSHGADQYGATPLSAADAPERNCNGSTAAKIDRENCNGDNVFFNAIHNTGDTANFFDDALVFSAKLLSTEPCAAKPVNWSSCAGTTTAMAHGAAAAVSNTVPGYTGSATYRCTDGTLALDPGSTCVAGTGAPPGTLYRTCSQYYVRQGPDTFASTCDCSDATVACASGSATMAHSGGDTSGCPGPSSYFPIQMDCYEEYSCTCN